MEIFQKIIFSFFFFFSQTVLFIFEGAEGENYALQVLSAELLFW